MNVLPMHVTFGTPETVTSPFETMFWKNSSGDLTSLPEAVKAPVIDTLVDVNTHSPTPIR